MNKMPINEIIEESKGAELIKQGAARYIRCECEKKFSNVFLDKIAYNGNWYILEKIKMDDGKVKNFFINIDERGEYKDRIVPAKV